MREDLGKGSLKEMCQHFKSVQKSVAFQVVDFENFDFAENEGSLIGSISKLTLTRYELLSGRGKLFWFYTLNTLNALYVSVSKSQVRPAAVVPTSGQPPLICAPGCPRAQPGSGLSGLSVSMTHL